MEKSSLESVAESDPPRWLTWRTVEAAIAHSAWASLVVAGVEWAVTRRRTSRAR